MALAPITLIAVDRCAQFVDKIANFLAIVQGLNFIILYSLWFDTRNRLITRGLDTHNLSGVLIRRHEHEILNWNIEHTWSLIDSPASFQWPGPS